MSNDMVTFYREFNQAYNGALTEWRLEEGKWKGRLYEVPIEIDYEEGEHLILSIENEGKGYFQQLVPILSRYMNGEGPICSYYLGYQEVDYNNDPAILEWNLTYPEERLRFLKHLTKYEDQLHPKQLVKFFKTKQEKRWLFHLDTLDPVLFGENFPEHFYPTIQDQEEAGIFLTIEQLETIRYGVPSGTPLIERADALFYLSKTAEEARKFIEVNGTALPTPITDTVEYQIWYDRWKQYFDLDKQCAYMDARLHQRPTTSFHPEGDWQEYLTKERNARYQKEKTALAAQLFENGYLRHSIYDLLQVCDTNNLEDLFDTEEYYFGTFDLSTISVDALGLFDELLNKIKEGEYSIDFLPPTQQHEIKSFFTRYQVPIKEKGPQEEEKVFSKQLFPKGIPTKVKA